MEFLEITDEKIDAKIKTKFHVIDDATLGLRHYNTLLRKGDWIVKLESGNTFVVPCKETLDELCADRSDDLEKRIERLERRDILRYDWPFVWTSTQDDNTVTKTYVSDGASDIKVTL